MFQKWKQVRSKPKAKLSNATLTENVTSTNEAGASTLSMIRGSSWRDNVAKLRGALTPTLLAPNQYAIFVSELPKIQDFTKSTCAIVESAYVSKR